MLPPLLVSQGEEGKLVLLGREWIAREWDTPLNIDTPSEQWQGYPIIATAMTPITPQCTIRLLCIEHLNRNVMRLLLHSCHKHCGPRHWCIACKSRPKSQLPKWDLCSYWHWHRTACPKLGGVAGQLIRICHLSAPSEISIGTMHKFGAGRCWHMYQIITN